MHVFSWYLAISNTLGPFIEIIDVQADYGLLAQHEAQYFGSA
jgi:hypothetical protein